MIPAMPDPKIQPNVIIFPPIANLYCQDFSSFLYLSVIQHYKFN